MSTRHKRGGTFFIHPSVRSPKVKCKSSISNDQTNSNLGICRQWSGHECWDIRAAGTAQPSGREGDTPWSSVRTTRGRGGQASLWGALKPGKERQEGLRVSGRVGFCAACPCVCTSWKLSLVVCLLMHFTQFVLHFLKIYLFYLFLAALGLCCCPWAFSSCAERGLLIVAVCGLLIAVASLVAEHRPQARGLQ